MNAIRASVTYDGEKKEVNIFGGKGVIGKPEEVTINDVSIL